MTVITAEDEAAESEAIEGEAVESPPPANGVPPR
jgi:hypothetical protein